MVCDGKMPSPAQVGLDFFNFFRVNNSYLPQRFYYEVFFSLTN